MGRATGSYVTVRPSFGADNYEKLFGPLGHRNPRPVGQFAFAIQAGCRTGQSPHPETRQKQKRCLRWDCEAGDSTPRADEYDFQGLAETRAIKGPVRIWLKGTARCIFRTLRENVFQWQADESKAQRKTWGSFNQPREAAR